MQIKPEYAAKRYGCHLSVLVAPGFVLLANTLSPGPQMADRGGKITWKAIWGKMGWL